MIGMRSEIATSREERKTDVVAVTRRLLSGLVVAFWS